VPRSNVANQHGIGRASARCRAATGRRRPPASGGGGFGLT